MPSPTMSPPGRVDPHLVGALATMQNIKDKGGHVISGRGGNGLMSAFDTIEVIPVTGVIGAEVRGVDLRRPLPDEQRDEVHEALMRHLVLFFRGQELSEDEQLAFGAHFGPPVTASIDRRPGAEELLFVSLEDNPDSPPKADRWHTDVPMVPEPPDIAILHMMVAPPVGGDTMWVNTYG